MRRRRILCGLLAVLALLAGLAIPGPAAAHWASNRAEWFQGGPFQPLPPAARPRNARTAVAQSDNVQLLANIPEMVTAIALNFIGDTMFVSTTTGIYAYSVADPSQPSLIGALPQFIYENEDMDVDPKRGLLFISRDPRGIAGTTAFPYGQVQIIDVSLPHAMLEIARVTLPSGHTTACVSDCRFLWTGGPATGTGQPADWGGRPIFATDISDPSNPHVCPDPIDTGANDGKTDYAHDTFVDSQGIAWVSSRGGIRGYWTEGRHRNPVTGNEEQATGCKPIPYAGGGTPDSATPSRFMHNSNRPTSVKLGGETGRVLLGTEENIVTDCGTSGRFAAYDLRGSFEGEGFRDIARTKFRMRVLDTWTPEGQPGSTGCQSAHWFADRGDGILAYAFYEQGLRFLDVSDPTNIRQRGYWVGDGANAWAGYWRKGIAYVADFGRGVDILRFEGTPLSPEGAEAPPPGAGDRCRSRGAPRSRLDRRRSRVTRRRVALRGTARARACALSSGGNVPGRVKRVRVAVARELGRGRCGFLALNGRLGRPRRCASPRYLPAHHTTRWSLSRRVRLPAGRYRVVTQAFDAGGRSERPRVTRGLRVR
jgi:hypothetical protein